MKFIKSGNVFLEFKPLYKIDYLIPVGRLFSFSKKYEKKLLYLLRKRLKARAVYFNVPKFLFISYKFMIGFMLRQPTMDDILHPIDIDVQRLSGYY